MKTLLLLLVTTAAFGQQPPQEDPIGQQLFPPELIMSQSQKLHLDEKQRTTIKNEVQPAELHLTRLDLPDGTLPSEGLGLIAALAPSASHAPGSIAARSRAAASAAESPGGTRIPLPASVRATAPTVVDTTQRP